MSVVSAEDTGLEKATMRRTSWRLMPFLMLAHRLSHIDRVNVGFASLQVNKAVALVATVGTISLLVIGCRQPRTLVLRA
jgi:hypothetical protein